MVRALGVMAASTTPRCTTLFFFGLLVLGPSTLGRCKGFVSCFLFVFLSACLPCLSVGYFSPGTHQGGLVHAKQIHPRDCLAHTLVR
ncbi:hypothetical protein P167DRAFT_313427 [Morchella conica CCBAS932]|uniref:Uncharacterized protein n=1 Tax=Morchella conica CCBAS932 TaxID=1392247 RepID=A0A3N4L0I3_9PEZI|nr:hypothetical protein P167DRAFT_313427 [Morchella conica CCBAS932]